MDCLNIVCKVNNKSNKNLPVCFDTAYSRGQMIWGGPEGRMAEQQFELWWGNFNEVVLRARKKAPVDSFLFQDREWNTTFPFFFGTKS